VVLRNDPVLYGWESTLTGALLAGTRQIFAT
jgi:hypothetical protein